jgi:heme-degrading monooxygenase HmoA
MIARQWRGLAKEEHAALYTEHLRFETIPMLQAIPGFISASILRRAVPQAVKFLVITHWVSLEAIRAFAGDNVEAAVVPQNVREMMLDYDQTVRHYEVVV